MSAHFYQGSREMGKPVVLADGKELHPRRSQSIANHSPTGFEWSYGGSGPAQLALAILLDVTDDPMFAQRNYQAFKFDVVAAFPKEKWELTASEVREWLAINGKRPRGTESPDVTAMIGGLLMAVLCVGHLWAETPDPDGLYTQGVSSQAVVHAFEPSEEWMERIATREACRVQHEQWREASDEYSAGRITLKEFDRITDGRRTWQPCE